MLIDIYEHMNIYSSPHGGDYGDGEDADQRAEANQSSIGCFAKGGDFGQWVHSQSAGEGIQAPKGTAIVNVTYLRCTVCSELLNQEVL